MHTDVDQVADRIYRLSTCIPDAAPGGFTFNQFLVDAEEPLLYHTGMRSLFPLVREAVDRVIEDDEREERFRRALSAVGRFSSGVSDVSVEHDRELDAAFGEH